MSRIEVMNLRDTKPIRPYDVRVDRTTPLGNPYLMKSEKQREAVCDKYIEWLDGQIKDQTEILDVLQVLMNRYEKYGRLRLFCWCAPKRCHADYIKEILDNAVIHCNELKLKLKEKD